MSFKKPADPYDPFATLRPGQTCKHCGKTFLGNHDASATGAVICKHAPHNDCWPRWNQHGLVTADDKPYLSIMEQIGALACLVEERTQADAYDDATASIRLLVARLARRPQSLVKPVEDWFEPDPEPRPRAARNRWRDPERKPRKEPT